jgi:hypothetical protein
VKWDSDNISISNAEAVTIQADPAAPNKFTAYFSTSDDISQLMVYPNPASETVQVGFLLDQAGQGKAEVINMLGQTIILQEQLSFGEGINKLELDVRALSAGVYMLNITTGDGIKSARVVIR